MFAAPAIVWFSFFLLWPLVNTFYLSLTRWNSILDNPSYIGARNFTILFADPHFHAALLNTAVYVVVGMVAIIPIAFTFGFYFSLGGWSHRILLFRSSSLQPSRRQARNP